MAEDSKIDLVAQLPDEVLMQIFCHLPSLRDKLRLESVNTRFQRCLIELLRTRPIPFTFTYDATRVERLNGYRLPKPFPEVLKSLGKKAKFDSIEIKVLNPGGGNAVIWRELDSVLAALVSSDIGCLDEVTTFKVHSEGGCSETLLRDLFAKCAKLSGMRLDFGPFPLNLGVILKEKALAQFSADLFHYTQEQVIQMFQAIKPNTLQKIDLRIGTTALNMDELVAELRDGGWSALEEIDIDWCMYNLPIDTLFSSLTRLHKLQKCNFVLTEMRQNAQLIPAPTSLAAGLTFLFANHAEITVEYELFTLFPPGLTGCQFVALIRQVQSAHPDLEVRFGPTGGFLILTLGKVSFKLELVEPKPCDNADCPDCRIFSPTLLFRIAFRLPDGGQQEVLHLANARLDRCMVDSVASNLNGSGWWKAVEAQMNEARDMATITFKPHDWDGRDQFQVTVDCGHCLNNSCFGCLYVG